MPNNNRKSNRGLPLLILLVMILTFAYMFRQMSKNEIAYSELLQKFREEKISEFSLNLGSGRLIYKEEGEKGDQQYTLPSVDLFLYDTRDLIQQYNETHKEPMKYDLIPASN